MSLTRPSTGVRTCVCASSAAAGRSRISTLGGRRRPSAMERGFVMASVCYPEPVLTAP
jgi:hypothetical protein